MATQLLLALSPLHWECRRSLLEVGKPLRVSSSERRRSHGEGGLKVAARFAPSFYPLSPCAEEGECAGFVFNTAWLPRPSRPEGITALAGPTKTTTSSRIPRDVDLHHLARWVSQRVLSRFARPPGGMAAPVAADCQRASLQEIRQRQSQAQVLSAHVGRLTSRGIFRDQDEDGVPEGRETPIVALRHGQTLSNQQLAGTRVP